MPSKAFQRIAVTASAAVLAMMVLSGCEGVAHVHSAPGMADPAGGGAAGVSAAGYIVADFHTKKVLVSHQPVKRLPVAGLTKVASAIVALDWAEAAGAPLTTMVVVPESAHPNLPGPSSSLGLLPGDRLSLRDALYAMLMVDDSASCMAVADFIGRDLLVRIGRAGDPIGHFVLQLNALAARVGMSNTRFVDPHGLGDERGKASYSTAADMAKLAMEAASRSAILFYSGQREREVAVYKAGGDRRFKMKNMNVLVGRQGIDGFRVGTSQRAGPCLMLTAARASKIQKLPDGRTQITPQRMVVVVLNSADHFGLGEGLLQEGWRRYDAWYAAGMTYTSGQEFLQNL